MCRKHFIPLSPPFRTYSTILQYTQDAKKCAQAYVLLLTEEYQLADSLAFLANDSDDINHIPAFCIQQGLVTSLTNVLLAVNCAQWQAGSQSLRRLRTGFERILFVLSDSVQGELKLSIVFVTYTTCREPMSLEMERDVFGAVVSICTERILLRLDSHTAREDYQSETFSKPFVLQSNALLNFVCRLQTPVISCCVLLSKRQSLSLGWLTIGSIFKFSCD